MLNTLTIQCNTGAQRNPPVRFQARSGRTARLANGSEAIVAAIILFALSLPIVTFTPSLNMNGMSRAANQLARKTVRGHAPLAVQINALAVLQYKTAR